MNKILLILLFSGCAIAKPIKSQPKAVIHPIYTDELLYAHIGHDDTVRYDIKGKDTNIIVINKGTTYQHECYNCYIANKDSVMFDILKK